MTDSRSTIEQAFSQLALCPALADDTDRMVTEAINWYTCVKPKLSPQLVRQRPRLVKDAVGDYLYIAGCNLNAVLDRLPADCNQDVLTQVATKYMSRLVAQQYPDLIAAMHRAVATGKAHQSPLRDAFRKRNQTLAAFTLTNDGGTFSFVPSRSS
ncbi:MAG: hypothetical protein AB8B99_11585 [Phormidesmis sp.]